MNESDKPENKSLEVKVKEFYEKCWNQKDFDSLEKLIDPKYHPEWVLMEERGPALLRKEISYITKAIPDVIYEIKKMCVDKTDVWVWYTMSGTQTEDFFGFPPSNKKFISDGASIISFNNAGKIIDQKGFYCFEKVFLNSYLYWRGVLKLFSSRYSYIL